MTREEAIKDIRDAKITCCPYGYYEALDMAIEALQTPPISQRSMYQAGYRQGKEDALSDDDLIKRSVAIETIELVDWYHQNGNKDMVSGANDDKHQAWYKAEDVYKALEAVPSADRPRGEWVEQEDDYHHYWECSECGMGVGLDDIRNFCPNCGSDNRERREE